MIDKGLEKICTGCKFMITHYDMNYVTCVVCPPQFQLKNSYLFSGFCQSEDIRHTLGMKELYQQRKQTIERLFVTAKENHGFRYTQQYGKARMEMKVGLTYACMNLKKLAGILKRKGWLPGRPTSIHGEISVFSSFFLKRRKAMLCLVA